METSDNQTLKNLKLIVFDLDGTLLNDKGEIGESSKQLIKELKNLGMKFSLASGRLHSAMLDYAKELDIQMPLISLDGAFIKSCFSDEIIWQSYIPTKTVKKAIKLANKHFVRYILCGSEAIYYTESNAMIPQLVHKFGSKFTEVESYNDYTSKTLEMVFLADMKENINYIRKHLSFPYSINLNVNYYRSESRNGLYFVEVRKAGNNKAEAVKKLLKYYKIKINEVAVLGDWYNDRTLFETNAFKVALDNAVPEIKYKADLIIDKSNEEDGTADFLEEVLKAKKD